MEGGDGEWKGGGEHGMSCDFVEKCGWSFNGVKQCGDITQHDKLRNSQTQKEKSMVGCEKRVSSQLSVSSHIQEAKSKRVITNRSDLNRRPKELKKGSLASIPSRAQLHAGQDTVCQILGLNSKKVITIVQGILIRTCSFSKLTDARCVGI